MHVTEPLGTVLGRREKKNEDLFFCLSSSASSQNGRAVGFKAFRVVVPPRMIRNGL